MEHSCLMQNVHGIDHMEHMKIKKNVFLHFC